MEKKRFFIFIVFFVVVHHRDEGKMQFKCIEEYVEEMRRYSHRLISILTKKNPVFQEFLFVIVLRHYLVV